MFHLLVVYSYLMVGLYNMIYQTNIEYNNIYILILCFITLKVVTNYRICSIAYLECKVRKVKREDSYMNKFLDPIVDLRYTDHIYILLPTVYFILGYYLIYMKMIQKII